MGRGRLEEDARAWGLSIGFEWDSLDVRFARAYLDGFDGARYQSHVLVARQEFMTAYRVGMLDVLHRERTLDRFGGKLQPFSMGEKDVLGMALVLGRSTSAEHGRFAPQREPSVSAAVPYLVVPSRPHVIVLKVVRGDFLEDAAVGLEDEQVGRFDGVVERRRGEELAVLGDGEVLLAQRDQAHATPPSGDRLDFGEIPFRMVDGEPRRSVRIGVRHIVQDAP